MIKKFKIRKFSIINNEYKPYNLIITKKEKYNFKFQKVITNNKEQKTESKDIMIDTEIDSNRP